eukprot:GHVR01048893.1.p1 GENE.GHVR01048893.1~~GHVR01048893.1.p1  ORF type:complete len:112 (-),score=2.66 GHVR01048893.1:140-475(-)
MFNIYYSQVVPDICTNVHKMLCVTFVHMERLIYLLHLLVIQEAYHRHDLIARVFHLKLNNLMKYLTKRHVLGKVRCYIYTVGWQKRGLPHAHILLWFVEKMHSDMIDRAIK